MSLQRAILTVHGAVQGVGFRPHVFRLATELRLPGWVMNSSAGVLIEVEGAPKLLQQFQARLEQEKPPRAQIQRLDCSFAAAIGYDGFEIRFSDASGAKTALILPDLATCADCLQEIQDPANRRHRYPFTNCTHCGPRFSILEGLPYDRGHTSMKSFAMCTDCQREYHDPRNRRFHAQPNACSRCGPQLELWNPLPLAKGEDALRIACEFLRSGKIVALKGIGGFQLLVDARNEAATRRLRRRKQRAEKPFAVMAPSLEWVRGECEISGLESALLLSPEAPIVLLRRRPGINTLAPSLAPRNPLLGVMLPSSPLHHLLLGDLGFPVVATSGNLGEEPICFLEQEALTRLGTIADAFLVHNRPILRQLDDSIVRVICGRQLLLRRSRGYAPLPIPLPQPIPCLLAMGAQLKNSVALSVGSDVLLSQHVGDLETIQAWNAFQAVAADLSQLYQATPKLFACDMHPDYLSTQFSTALPAPRFAVQHHWAHALSCMAENHLEEPVLAVTWDGTGFGTDRTIWGGEFLLADASGFQRLAHLRHFRLPGGAAAIKQPRRSAIGLLHALWGKSAFARRHLLPIQSFSERELALIGQAFTRELNVPVTSSAGRLFDGVASLLGLCQRASFEGQGAMELEFASESGIEESYPFLISDEQPWILDWGPMIAALLLDLHGSGFIAAKFHNTLTEMILAVARRVEHQPVVLTGGCFQNAYLLERTVRRLRAEGFRPYWHQLVPPNDGGIALGQLIAASHSLTARAMPLEKEEAFQ